MSAALATALYAQMTASQGAGTFYNALGGRIYENAGPENATLPLAVTRITDNRTDPFFDGKTRAVLTIEVETFGNRDAGPIAVQAIDDLLFSACHLQVRTSVTGFDRATIICTGRGVPVVMEDAIAVTSTYTVDGTTT